jgi:GNAT superfamily N-acetyltransferase
MGESFVANLANLTAFWRALGAEPLPLAEAGEAARSRSWPHRLWFEPGLGPSPAQVRSLVEQEAQAPCVVPVWRDDADEARGDPLAAALAAAGVPLRTSTVVMDADIAAIRWLAVADVELQFDDGKRDVVTWSQVAGRSFGYEVDPAAVARLVEHHEAWLVLARRGERPVGTGLLFETGEVAGLHMLGVLPEARRTGVAGAVMLRLLREAEWRGLRHAALQASAMGQGLYDKLGFVRSGAVDWHGRAQG